jgi:transcription antitermination factor NusG
VCADSKKGIIMRHWYALHVRPKYERVVANALTSKGLDCFLPVHRVQKRWSDRLHQSEEPLFPCYLFGRIDPLRRLPILVTPGVISIVSYGTEPARIDEGEMEAIQTIAQSQVLAEPWPYLQAGDTVCIEKGPLAGLSGILVRAKSSCRLVVSISLIQRSIAAEVDADMVCGVRNAQIWRAAAS